MDFPRTDRSEIVTKDAVGGEATNINVSDLNRHPRRTAGTRNKGTNKTEFVAGDAQIAVPPNATADQPGGVWSM
jgi:hypothetical protein